MIIQEVAGPDLQFSDADGAAVTESTTLQWHHRDNLDGVFREAVLYYYVLIHKFPNLIFSNYDVRFTATSCSLVEMANSIVEHDMNHQES